MSMYTNNPDAFLKADKLEGVFDDAWNDIKTAASDTVDKWSKAGKRAIGLDTGSGTNESGGTPTPTSTTEEPKKSNTLLYVGIGGASLLVLYLLLKPKKGKRKN